MNSEDGKQSAGALGAALAGADTMELRDYFAASALQGLATRRPAGAPTSAGELARFAYEIADAMLATRGK